jgi:hypothetical protein
MFQKSSQSIRKGLYAAGLKMGILSLVKWQSRTGLGSAGFPVGCLVVRFGPLSLIYYIQGSRFFCQDLFSAD